MKRLKTLARHLSEGINITAEAPSDELQAQKGTLSGVTPRCTQSTTP